MEQGWLRIEKIDTDCKQRILKSLAKLFKPFNRDWAPLTREIRPDHNTGDFIPYSLRVCVCVCVCVCVWVN